MLPSADGSLPKLGPEQKELVTEYIPEVMRIMDRLEQQGHHHRDARVALYATEALSYDVSVKSVVKAARTYILSGHGHGCMMGFLPFLPTHPPTHSPCPSTPQRNWPASSRTLT